MARPGRKRKIAPRERNGRISRRREDQPPAQPIDYGPPEVQARRMGLGGTVQTDNPLPGLVASGALSQAQAEAGERYAQAVIRVIGPHATGAQAARYAEYIPGDPANDRDDTAAAHAYYRARRALRTALGVHDGMRADAAVRLVCVEWRPLRERSRRMQHLRAGLDALARHYGVR